MLNYTRVLFVLYFYPGEIIRHLTEGDLVSANPIPPSSRRELARRARDAFPPMGVFVVRNLASGRARVKSSRNVPGAINRLRFELGLGTHLDKTLQAEWNAVGSEGFSMDVIELVRQREDAAFDYAGELRLLEHLYRLELEQGGAR